MREIGRFTRVRLAVFPKGFVEFQPFVIQDESLDDEFPQGLAGPISNRRLWRKQTCGGTTDFFNRHSGREPEGHVPCEWPNRTSGQSGRCDRLFEK